MTENFESDSDSGAETAADPTAVPRLSPEELRTLFLFEALEPEQLEWLAANGRTETRTGGSVVYGQGEDATCMFVLLSGTIALRKLIEGSEVETTRTDQRGVYGGATTSFVRSSEAPAYQTSMVAITDAEFWVIEADAFGQKFRQWFPMAMHMLEGLTMGWRSSQVLIAQRERLLSLGRLAAGLTHELNNPASAAVRATASLREKVSHMRRKLAYLTNKKIDPELLWKLTELQEAAVERIAKNGRDDRSAMEVADAEDALGEWLEDRGVGNAWDLAPTLVAAGVGEDWLTELEGMLPNGVFADGVGWVTYALDTELLMMEIEDSTDRISHLVNAARQYSQLDRAPHADVDLREGLKSTLVMLHHKIEKAGVTLQKDFSPDLPLVPAYPGELNQVWTNLIDNAVAAMPDGGTLTVRTALDGDRALVEICDTGVGVPKELQGKIFEPFFTTKPVGEGTGLGLDISYRVIAQRHRGDLRVVSVPGDTRFQVRLPLVEPPSMG